MNDKNFNKKVHTLGRLTVGLALLCFICLAFALGAMEDIDFDVVSALKNGVPILLTFAIAGVCENLSFAPIIGCGALYMACVTGNVSNMKIPAAMNAIDVSGHAAGTPKGDVISMIAVAASSVVTTLIVFLGMLFLGMLFLAPLFEPVYNNEFLKPAFQNMVPALFCAILFPQIAKAPKQSVIAVGLPLTVRLVMGSAFFSSNSSYIMVATIIATALASVWMKKKNMI